MEPGKGKRNKKVDYAKCGERPPLEGAVGVDRLCVPLEGGKQRQQRGAVAYLLSEMAAVTHEAEAAAARSWQELHSGPRWSIEVVTEQGAKARILQAPSSELSSLAALLRDTARWGVRRRQDPGGARLVLGLGMLLAMGGDEAGEMGAVVTGGNAAEVSVDCMLVQGDVGNDRLLAIDPNGRRAMPMDGGEAAPNGGLIVRDWGAARRWVEAWVVR